MKLDAVSLDRIKTLHPLIRNTVLDGLRRCYEVGVPIRITQALRTIAEQNALYAQGRTAPGKIVTYAQGGYSYHNYGLAFDFCLLYNGREVSWNTKEDRDQDKIADWMEVVNVFTGLGFTWGGVWPKPKTDTPHFEKTFGRSVRELLTRHNAGKTRDGYVVNIEQYEMV